MYSGGAIALTQPLPLGTWLMATTSSTRRVEPVAPVELVEDCSPHVEPLAELAAPAPLAPLPSAPLPPPLALGALLASTSTLGLGAYLLKILAA